MEFNIDVFTDYLAKYGVITIFIYCRFSRVLESARVSCRCHYAPFRNLDLSRRH
jgi:hypothetical protein